MAVKTSTFSGWQLSGEDAQNFLQQIENPEPNPLAKAAIEQGRMLAEEYLAKGYVIFKLKEERSLRKD